MWKDEPGCKMIFPPSNYKPNYFMDLLWKLVCNVWRCCLLYGSSKKVERDEMNEKTGSWYIVFIFLRLILILTFIFHIEKPKTQHDGWPNRRKSKKENNANCIYTVHIGTLLSVLYLYTIHIVKSIRVSGSLLADWIWLVNDLWRN
jgi:uncharacterized membrane protein